MTQADLLDLLVRHTEAWNRHDLDALMDLFDDDCMFEASVRDGKILTKNSFRKQRPPLDSRQ